MLLCSIDFECLVFFYHFNWFDHSPLSGTHFKPASPLPEFSTTWSDQQLLEAIASGSEPAFNELFRRYWQELYELAWKSLKDDMLAREAVHDVLVEIWQRKGGKPIDNPIAYLKTSVRNRVINAIRNHKNKDFFALFEDIASSPYLADSPVLEKNLGELVFAWIEALPRKRKAIFVRHFFRQLSTREIASELDINQKTVQNQVGRTLEYLRKHFGDLLSLLV